MSKASIYQELHCDEHTRVDLERIAAKALAESGVDETLEAAVFAEGASTTFNSLLSSRLAALPDGLSDTQLVEACVPVVRRFLKYIEQRGLPSLLEGHAS